MRARRDKTQAGWVVEVMARDVEVRFILRQVRSEAIEAEVRTCEPRRNIVRLKFDSAAMRGNDHDIGSFHELHGSREVAPLDVRCGESGKGSVLGESAVH